MNEQPINPIRGPSDPWNRVNHVLLSAPRHTVVALILVAALLAFEAFNFDTTQFALADLLGEASFAGLSWAAVLGFAFCAIDFAGLVRIFTPEQGGAESKEVWYLMGAWLLGATMNAIMTWYAVSLRVLERPWHTAEVLTAEQLLTIVPIFVAVLVWLTRILFIGALSVAGEHLFAVARTAVPQPHPMPASLPTPLQQPPVRERIQRPTAAPPAPAPVPPHNPSRIRQRPPLTHQTVGMKAMGRGEE